MQTQCSWSPENSHEISGWETARHGLRQILYIDDMRLKWWNTAAASKYEMACIVYATVRQANPQLMVSKPQKKKWDVGIQLDQTHRAHKRLDRYTDYRTPVRVRLLCTNMQYRPQTLYKTCTAALNSKRHGRARAKKNLSPNGQRGYARRGRINPSNDGNKWLALGAPRTIIMAEHFLYLCF